MRARLALTAQITHDRCEAQADSAKYIIAVASLSDRIRLMFFDLRSCV
jgi:hypothetical protein